MNLKNLEIDPKFTAPFLFNTMCVTTLVVLGRAAESNVLHDPSGVTGLIILLGLAATVFAGYRFWMLTIEIDGVEKYGPVTKEGELNTHIRNVKTEIEDDPDHPSQAKSLAMLADRLFTVPLPISLAIRYLPQLGLIFTLVGCVAAFQGFQTSFNESVSGNDGLEIIINGIRTAFATSIAGYGFKLSLGVLQAATEKHASLVYQAHEREGELLVEEASKRLALKAEELTGTLPAEFEPHDELIEKQTELIERLLATCDQLQLTLDLLLQRLMEDRGEA